MAHDLANPDAFADALADGDGQAVAVIRLTKPLP